MALRVISSAAVFTLALMVREAGAQATPRYAGSDSLPSMAAGSNAASQPIRGPRADAVRVGISRASESATLRRDVAPAPYLPQAQTRQNGRVLAIIGGALFLGGLIIDDDAGTAIAVAGLAIGVWGLYLWMR